MKRKVETAEPKIMEVNLTQEGSTVENESLDQISEKTLENLEPIIEEINYISDSIEEKGEEISQNSGNPILIEKNKTILEELYNKGVFFLKQVSKQLANYPKGVAESFRDKNINKKSLSLEEKFGENKALDKYNNAKYDKTLSEDELNSFKEKARSSFDSKYKSLIPLLKTIESNNWGNSKNKVNAIQGINNLFYAVSRQANILERNDEAFNIIKVYENSLPLNDDKVHENNFSAIVCNTVDNLTSEGKTSDNKEISDICRGDPYLIIKYIDNIYDYNKGTNYVFIEEQIDKIIEEFHQSSSCNLLVSKTLDRALNFDPEKYGLDPRNRKFIFESFLRNNLKNRGSGLLSDNLHFFHKELSNLQEKEIEEIILSYSSHQMGKEDANTLLSFADLSEKNLESIYDKISLNYRSEEEIKYSKEALLSRFEGSDMPFVPFFKYQQFNLNAETRINLFRKIIDNSNKCANNFSTLTHILSDFKNVFNGINEDEYESLLLQYIEKSIDGKIGQIRTLYALLSEYDIPLKYKEEINKIFSMSYSGRDRSIGKMFTDQKDPSELSKNEEWLKGNKEILPSLEIGFYENGDMNDLRHFFYDVIEGKRVSVNIDLLMNQYAKRTYDFSAEEYLDLFIIRKKIPLSYSNIFAQKMQYEGNISLFSQIDEAVRLNQISEEERKSILCGFVSGGSYQNGENSLATKAFDLCINNNIIPDLEKDKLFEDFVKNLTKQFSTNTNIHPDYLYGIIVQKLFNSNITEEEKSSLFSKFYNELLNYENLHGKIIEITNENVLLFNKGFKDDKSKGEFVSKLLESKNYHVISQLLEGYLSCLDNPNKENNHPIFSQVNEEKFKSLFENGLSLDKLKIDNALMGYFRMLSGYQKKLLLEHFFLKDDIFNGWSDGNEISDFCHKMVFAVEQEKLKEDKDRVISDEDARILFDKIFLNEKITTNAIGDLLGYSSDFLLEDKHIFDSYIISAAKNGGSKNCCNILKHFNSSDKPIFSLEQAKSLSAKVMENKYLDKSIYEMYINSTPDNVGFYLDQEIFDLNIKKMCRPDDHVDVGATVDFLVFYRGMKDAKKTENKASLSNEQEETLFKKFLKQGMDVSNIEKFYDLDSELFNRLIDQTIAEKKLSNGSLSSLIKAKEEISGDNFSKITDYYFNTVVGVNSFFDDICDRYSSDPGKLREIKDKINNLSKIESRTLFKSKLLQKDLFTPEELRGFYGEIRTDPNVQSQTLISAEVLGSLVYGLQSEKVSNVLENETTEAKKGAEFISSFVKKYPLQSKGRTIAVMLFSKEYLPERSMGEVIEKVADRLSKYERILDKYNYEGVPDGIKASIGLEYEITSSTAQGYKEVTDRELKNDIVRLSAAAHIGNGADAVHEIATRPTVNPYLTLLEMQILEDLKYINLNYDYSEKYQKGARGYHLTIGGEKGLSVNANTNFLQNSILAASWGGIHSGETGKRVSGGRGVTLRGRSANDGHNVKVFDKATESVELRSLSIDKMEPFQRAVVTAYNGAIAIQALEKYTNLTSDVISRFYKNNSIVNSEQDFTKELKKGDYVKDGYDTDEKNMKIIYAWAELTSNINEAVEYHNNEFLSGETTGYLDNEGVWVDSSDFRGSYNKTRFDSVVTSIDPTLSVEEYVNSTKINMNDFFSSFDVELADSFTKVNNLFLKPDNKILIEEKGKVDKTQISLGGDQANAISMLEVTKLDNESVEYRNDSAYLKSTVFETLGERREGYYCVQGGSEKMITHACQIALLNFNKKIEEIVNN